MKILVTGGAGFIGSHLVDRLVEEGHKVTVLDSLCSPLGDRYLRKDVGFIKADIRNHKELAGVERHDVVYHLAAQVSVTASNSPGSDVDFETNCIGSKNVIDLSMSWDRAPDHFVYISTGGALYGDCDKYPIEDSEEISPVSTYGVNKYYGESYLKMLGRRDGLRFTVFRLSNIFGPRQVPKGEAGVVPIFAEMMHKGQSPRIFGDGTKTRDYLHVLDVIDALVASIQTPRDTHVTLASGIETTDLEVYQAVARVLGFDGEPVYCDVRKGEVIRSVFSVEKTRNLTGWEAKRKFSDEAIGFIRET